MGTVPIHESVAKVATRDLLGVENGFAVSKTGHIALLRHNQIQWLVRPIAGAGAGEANQLGRLPSGFIVAWAKSARNE